MRTPLRPSGVYMLPVPQAGVLRAVEGRADAEAVPGITGFTITIPLGRFVRPLPTGISSWAWSSPKPPPGH